MFKDKLIDRANERTTPIIGNAGPKSWRYVYFAKKINSKIGDISL
jgi:hypothetical protein